MDEKKIAALLQWINCLNVGPHLTTLKQLCSGHHFIGIIRLIFISRNNALNKSNLILENWPQTVQQFLEDYYAIRIQSAVDLNLVAVFQNELEIAKVAVLILCASINNEGQEHFLNPLTKLSADTQEVIKDIIEGVLSSDSFSLNPNFPGVLIRTGNGDVPTKIDKVKQDPSNVYVYDCDSSSPINQFLFSPQILQKMAVRERELLIRKLKNDLSAEIEVKMELELEVKSSKEMICSLEHDIGKLKSKITDLRIQANDLVNYKALLQDREEELKKLVIRCQKLEGELSDYSSLKTSNECLVKEKMDLEEQLEKLNKAYKSCSVNLKVKSDLEVKLETLQITVREKDELISTLNRCLKEKDCLLKELQDIQSEQDMIRNLEQFKMPRTSPVGEPMSVVTDIMNLEELLAEKEKSLEALATELQQVKSEASEKIKILSEEHHLVKCNLLEQIEKCKLTYTQFHEINEQFVLLKKDHSLVKKEVLEYRQQCKCLLEHEVKQWHVCKDEFLAKTRVEMQKYEATIEHVKKEMRDQQEICRTAEVQHAEQKNILESQLKDLSDMHREAEKSVNEKESFIKKLTDEINDLVCKNENYKKEHEIVSEELKTKEEQIQKLQTKESEIRVIHNELVIKMELLTSNLMTSQQKIRQLESDAQLNIQCYEETIKQQQTETRNMQDSYRRSEEENMKILAMMKSQLEALAEDCDKLKNIIKEKETVIDQLQDEIKGFVYKSDSCKQEYDRILEALREKDNYTLILETQKCKIQCEHERLIKETELMKAQLIECQNKTTELGMGVQIREDALTKAQQEINNYQATVAKLHSEAEEKEIGFKNAEQQYVQHINLLANQLEESKERVLQMEKTMQEKESIMESQLEALAADYRKLKNVIKEKESLTEELQDKIKDLVCKNDSCKQEYDRILDMLRGEKDYTRMLETQKCEIKSEHEILIKETELMKAQLIESQNKTKELEGGIQIQEDALTKAQQEISNYEATVAKLNSEAEEKEIGYRHAEEQYVQHMNLLANQLEDNKERLLQMEKGRQEQESIMEGQLEALKEDCRKLKNVITEKESLNEQFQDKIKDLVCKNDNYKQEYDGVLEVLRGKDDYTRMLEIQKCEIQCQHERLIKETESIKAQLIENQNRMKELEGDVQNCHHWKDALTKVQQEIGDYQRTVQKLNNEAKEKEKSYRNNEADYVQKMNSLSNQIEKNKERLLQMEKARNEIEVIMEDKLDTFAEDCRQLKNVIKEKEGLIEELQDKIKDFVCKSDSCKQEYDRILQELSGREDYIRTLESQKCEVQCEHERLIKDTELMNAQVIESQNKTKELEMSVQTLEDALTKAQQEISNYQVAVEKLNNEAKEKEFSYRSKEEQQVEIARNEKAIMEDKLNAVAEDCRKLKIEINEKESLIEQLQDKIKDLVCKNDSCKQDYDGILVTLKRNEDYTRTMETQKGEIQCEHERLTEETELMKAQLIESENKVKALEANVQNQENALAKAQQEISKYQSILQKLNNESEEKEISYRSREEQYVQQVNSLINQLEKYKEVIMEGQLETLAKVKKMINEKESIIGKLQERIKEIIHKNESHEHGHVVQFQDVRRELEVKEADYSDMVNTLGTVWKKTTSLIIRVGKLKHQLSQTCVKQHLELDMTAKRIQNLESSVAELEMQPVLPKDMKESIHKILVDFKEEIQTLEDNVITFCKNFIAKDVELTKYLQKTISMMNELTSEKDMNRRLMETNEMKRKEILRLEALIADTEKKLTIQKDMYQAHLEMNNQERETLLSKYDTLRVQFLELQQKLKCDKQLAHFHKEFTGQIEDMQRQVANAEKQHATTVVIMTERITAMSEKLEKAKSIISVLNCEKDELIGQIRNLQLQLDLANQKLKCFKRRDSVSCMPSVTVTCDTLDTIKLNFEDGQHRDARDFDDTFSINASSCDLAMSQNFSAVEGTSALHPLSILPAKAGSCFPCADEQGELLNFSYLNDLKSGKCLEVNDAGRIEELQRRNSLCLPHLRSCYPVETQVQPPNKFKDEDVKVLSEINVSQRLSCTYNLPGGSNDQSSTETCGTKPRAKSIQPAYRKPGPPTPGRTKSPPAAQLKQKSKTPTSFKKFLRPKRFITPKGFRMKGTTPKRRNQENHPPQVAVPLVRRNIAFTVGFSPKTKLQAKTSK